MSDSADSRNIYCARVNQALSYIEANLAQDLSLEQIAQAAYFSPFHFHRIFAELVGETPHDFIHRVRLERAANMLCKMRALSITEIALACGFSSSAVFARAFRNHFGVSARAYRRTGPNISTAFLATPAAQVSETALSITAQLKRMPALHLAYVPTWGYDLDSICRAWDKLRQWAAARELITPQSQVIGISFDDPFITPPGKCRYYACLTVTENAAPDHTVGMLDLPEGKYAVARVTCAANEIQLGYRYLYGAWFPDSGCQPDDRPSYEIYHATPDTHPDGKFVLDLCIPARTL